MNLLRCGIVFCFWCTSLALMLCRQGIIILCALEWPHCIAFASVTLVSEIWSLPTWKAFAWRFLHASSTNERPNSLCRVVQLDTERETRTAKGSTRTRAKTHARLPTCLDYSKWKMSLSGLPKILRFSSLADFNQMCKGTGKFHPRTDHEVPEEE
jgi:hypothetical protein